MQSTPQAPQAPRYVVMTAAAHVAGQARTYGTYRRVAVVEVTAGFAGRPAMISERAKGVARIVQDYGACNVGTTERCEYARRLADAEALAARLSAG